jgi:hypothetical protein
MPYNQNGPITEYWPYNPVFDLLNDAHSESNLSQKTALLESALNALPNKQHGIAKEIESTLTAIQNQDDHLTSEHLQSALSLSYHHQDNSLVNVALSQNPSSANVAESIEKNLINHALGSDANPDPETRIKASAADLRDGQKIASAMLEDPNIVGAVKVFADQIRQDPFQTIIKPSVARNMAASFTRDEIRDLNQFLQNNEEDTTQYSPQDSIKQTFNTIAKTIRSEDIDTLAKILDGDWSKLISELPQITHNFSQQNFTLSNLSSPKQHPLISYFTQPSRIVSAPTGTSSGLPHLPSGFKTSLPNISLPNLKNLFGATSGPGGPGISGFLSNAGKGVAGGLKSLFGGLGPSLNAGSLIPKISGFLGSLGSGAGATAAAGGLGAAAIAGYVGIAILVIFLVILIVNPQASSQLINSGHGTGEGGDFVGQFCIPGDPGCPSILCPNCTSPVTCGDITQCPGGSYSHSSLNALDYGMNSCPSSSLGVYYHLPFEARVTDVMDSISSNFGTGYGNYINIEFTDPVSGRSYYLKYAHLAFNSAKVVEGQILPANSPPTYIATADHTGYSTATHLHFELNALDGYPAPSISTLVGDPGICL